MTSISTIAVIALAPFYPRIIARLGARVAIIVGIGISVAILLVGELHAATQLRFRRKS